METKYKADIGPEGSANKSVSIGNAVTNVVPHPILKLYLYYLEPR
jgi:hypothetical protein